MSQQWCPNSGVPAWPPIQKKPGEHVMAAKTRAGSSAHEHGAAGSGGVGYPGWWCGYWVRVGVPVPGTGSCTGPCTGPCWPYLALFRPYLALFRPLLALFSPI